MFVAYTLIARTEAPWPIFAYREASAWLRENADPATTVFAPEPGTLAYYSGCTFFDHYGPVTRRGWNVPLREVGLKLSGLFHKFCYV